MPNDVERRQRLNAIAEAVQQRGVKFVTVPDTLVAATHAARHGWISAETLPDIQTDERITRDYPEGGATSHHE